MQDFDDAPLDDVVELKTLSPDSAMRRRRPRYKVICTGERPKEVNERLLQLYPFVDQKVRTVPLIHMTFKLEKLELRKRAIMSRAIILKI